MESPTEIAYEEANINDNKQPGLIASSVIMLVVSVVAVTLRFLSRRIVHAKYGADDWWILFALFSIVGWITGSLLLVRLGYGRHTLAVSDSVAFDIDNCFWLAILATEALYNPAIIGIKLSILCLYHRLFPKLWLSWALLVVGVIVVSYSTTQFFAVVFQCVPTKAIWDPSVSGRCIDIGKLILVMSIFNIVTDVCILILPLPVIWKLQMSRSRKLQISGAFLFGVFVVIISIVRATYVLKTGQVDPAWNDVDGSELTGIELGVAILAACFPSYLPLVTGRSGHSSSNSRVRSDTRATEVRNLKRRMTTPRTGLRPQSSFQSVSALGSVSNAHVQPPEAQLSDADRLNSLNGNITLTSQVNIESYPMR